MFSHFFIKRPIFAMVISITIIILGLIAMISLPVERYPEVAPPSVTISATYPGADSETVANTVATVIEKEVNGVEGMIYMQSVSGNDGRMDLTVTFESGTDLDMANVLAQNRVTVATSKLPEEVKRLGVTTKKKSTSATAYIAIYSENGEFTDLFLSNYMNIQIRDEIARVAGVGDVMLFGVGDYSIRIWLNPDKLRNLDMNASDVVAAVRAQNMQVAAGQIGEPPVKSDIAFQYTVKVKGRLADPEEFGNIVLRSGSDGQVVRIKDVAKVELGADNYGMTATYKGMPSAVMAVYQIPGANAIAVADGVKAKLKELSAKFPKGLKYDLVYDSTDIIKASLKEVVTTLFITLILVILTVYIFLQNFRATVIPSVTIPVSLVGTFIVMAALGYSINQFTMFGLVLVIGIVVDDAIVVVENATRHLQSGKTPMQAAKDAMTEISGPVIATTLVLLSVFVPTAFMGGITGTLFKQFAVTISIATCFSTLNALTLSPALCAKILRKVDEDKVGPIFGAFNKVLDKTTNSYIGIVKFVIRRAMIGIVLFVVLTVTSIWGLNKLPTGFVPQEDEGFCIVNVQLPNAASQNRIKNFVKESNKIIESVPGVDRYITVTGYSMFDGVAVPNMAFSFVMFKDWDERDESESQDVIISSMNQKFSQLQDGLAFAIATPSLPGLGLSGGFTFMLQDIGGVGMKTLEKVAHSFVTDSSQEPAIQSMNSTFKSDVPQLEVDIDRDSILARGLNMQSVFDTLQVYLGSAYINDFTLYNQTFKVKAQASKEFRATPEDIKKLELRAADGNMIPLASVADVKEVFGPQSITHFNLYPSVKIMGGPNAGYSSGQAMDAVEEMAKSKLGSSLGLAWTELSFQERLATGSTGMIFLLAVVLVYLILAAQYESWTIPISVCMAVPIALAGAVLAVLSRGMDNNVYTQVGIVLLIGLSTKTAILIVEFAMTRHAEGASVFDAAVEAVKLRFRAVLMTAFSFILGVLPLLVATGAGAESRKVLGTVVFGGMMVATVLSLAIVPLIYYLIQTGENKLKKTDTGEKA
jgi:HAE1 family hydrophobic/amphiphilic exporter-1